MKKLKLFLLCAGGIAIVVAAVLLFMAVKVDLKVIWEIATRYQGGGSSSNLTDPRPKILIISGVALGAGLLIGLAIGLPLHRAPSQKEIDRMVEARVQQRLNPLPPDATGGPETPGQRTP